MTAKYNDKDWTKMPTPLEKKLGLAKRLWTEEELKDQFTAYIEEQNKQYDPKQEWEVGGWQMFPNHIGDYRMVVSFDTRVHISSDDLYQIDPLPRPWKIAYKVNWDDPDSGLIGNYSVNSFETLDQAREQFVKTAQEIEQKIRMAEITADSKRQGKCSCGKIYDWNPSDTKRGYPGMFTFRPYAEFDDVYDGCRGWD
jgi:hypothetical protein